MTEVKYRTPTVADAQPMLDLVRRTPELDENSWYYYALFSTHFCQTSLIAEVDEEFAAFVTAYRLPEDSQTLFLWQTASVLNHGVPNLGLNLLTTLVERCLVHGDLKYIEATIDPSNKAIAMQFRLLARSLKAASEVEIMFGRQESSELQHDEQLVRIGPLC